MNIEKMFLQKAIKDKNFISFSYKNKKYEKIKPLSLLDNILKSDKDEFNFLEIKKLNVFKR